MSFASQFHIMPANYHFEAPTSLNAGIFRPPVSPSASSYNLAKSTGSLISDVSSKNTPAPLLRRKRTHDDAQRESYPWTSEDPGSPMLGPTSANRYVLAGQIETPGAQTTAENGGLDDSMYSDVDYRRALGPRREDDVLETPSTRLARLQIGSDIQSGKQAPTSPGWSAFALNTIGGVVGKVWEFCKGGAFRGFYAGGGKGYEMQAGHSTPSNHQDKPWCNEHDVPTLRTDKSPPAMMSPPGAYPEPDYISYNYLETSAHDIPVRPAAKRRQLSEQDELRRNWVIVDEPSPQPRSKAKRAPPSTGASPAPSRASTRGQQPRYSMPTSASGRRISVPVSRVNVAERQGANRRASARISHAGSPSLSSREPASFAQPRSPRPSTPSGMSTRIPHPLNQTPNPFASIRAASPRPSSRQSSRRSSITSPTGTAFPPMPKAPSSSHRRNTSNASAASTARRKTGLVTDDIEASPRLDAEAKQLAAKKIVAEKQADARIEAFNSRLMEMIRQGKEALGTTVEVDMDEGWDDDD